MLARARKVAGRSDLSVEILAEAAEPLYLPMASADTVLVIYSLCTIPDPSAVWGARRALRGRAGRLLFCEHGRAPDEGVGRMQTGIEPVWKVVGGGRHLTRDIPALVSGSGFEIATIDTMYLAGTPRWVGVDYWGGPSPNEGSAAVDGVTVVAGLPVPSTSPVFLAAVGLHVLAGLTCVVTGAAAMLSRKGHGGHSTFGTIYFWSLAVVCLVSAGLAISRWAEDYPLFILGALALASAWFGRTAMRRRWPGFARLHIAGMGASYVVLLTAFYVDNGKNLPIWRTLPQIAFWLLPGVIGAPIIMWAMVRHPLARRAPSQASAR